MRKTNFDIALSFAGEQREYVDQVANILNQKGISTFYDKFEEANLWGKNLYDYLSDVYMNQARYTIMFISKDYSKKLWTNHERQSMQARAFQESSEYVLPAKFDDTEIAGVLPTTGYISLQDKTPEEFVFIIEKKLIYSGGTIPSENLRSALSTIVTIPKIDPKNVDLTVISDDYPIQGAQVCLIADNGTTLNGTTNNEGKVSFNITTRRLYSVLVAHPEYSSAVLEQFDTSEDLKITLKTIENIGSIICISTCHINGLKGRLNPILDSPRRYFYADNIAIHGGKEQPVMFKLNEPVQVEDCNGIIMNLIFRFMLGRTTLIDYVKPVFKE
ncbi:TIR domain-containing protein [Aquimarina sp. MMG016]|uniref:toll/interleukin-1 receptor domain-containing protein n=1 Tax=Aquimarina sp. MMG016 TaxID=2822690 RepID=UPI001B3A2F3F|nr:TIR domain-containing protein [Aquimarina sp. MMG016]MBQ4819164.1 toll/interleukin-1 receptor domain-containing protein [Aquimarina sp. MMG016]